MFVEVWKTHVAVVNCVKPVINLFALCFGAGPCGDTGLADKLAEFIKLTKTITQEFYSSPIF